MCKQPVCLSQSRGNMHAHAEAVAAARSTTTSDAAFPLQQCALHVGERDWTLLHTHAVISHDDEQAYLSSDRERLPYGVVLWPSAIALAHDIAARPHEFSAGRVLELGAGTGLPGIVAASCGAHVVQTDRHELALTLCRENGVRNAVHEIEYRLADWATWDDGRIYDWILGSDILYGDGMHPHLQRILERNLAPGGRVLLADPFRPMSIRLLEQLERDGWVLTMNKWSIGEGSNARAIGVFEVTHGGLTSAERMR